MIRNAASALVLSGMSLLAVACGAAPGEGLGTSTEADTAATCTTEPFTVLEKVAEGTTGGGGKGGGVAQVALETPKDESIIWSNQCTSLAGAPVAPGPDGYPGFNWIQACDEGTVVDSSSTLPGCTAGLQFGRPDGEYVNVFLCPLSTTTLPATVGGGSGQKGNMHTWSLSYQWLTNPYNACLGLPTDPTYGIVTEWFLTSDGEVGYPTCGSKCD